jgi:hypothetical protein
MASGGALVITTHETFKVSATMRWTASMATTDRKCAGCKDHIPKDSRYFQDVPGIGDLCSPCHRKRFG